LVPFPPPSQGSLTTGVEAPLLTGGFAILGTEDPLSSESPARCSRCTKNDDNVEGEATGLATSNDSGLDFGENEGIENVRANAAREGKEAEGVGETD